MDKCILVVEDDDISQFLISKMLEGLGYAVKIASNGPEALEILKSNYFDVILMDIEMPVISGYETIRRLKSGDYPNNIKNIPIIGISANPFEDNEEIYLEHGMNAYISKPIQVDDLNTKILELVQKKIA